MRTFLSDTEQHEIFSPTRGRGYVVSVVLPEGYRSSDKRYPVVYVLDGDVILGMVASLTGVAAWMGEVAERITVCVGYGAESYDGWADLRELDLAFPGTPVDDLRLPASRPQPEVFLAALADDIVPFVDDTYRTDPGDRSLYGYSWGGFFVLYALLQRLPTFHRYLSGGAFGYWTMGYLCHQAQLVKESGRGLAARVFVAMSEHEAPSCVAAMHEFVDTLTAAGGPDFRLVGEVFPTEGHNAAAVALTYLHGLGEVFAADT